MKQLRAKVRVSSARSAGEPAHKPFSPLPQPSTVEGGLDDNGQPPKKDLFDVTSVKQHDRDQMKRFMMKSNINNTSPSGTPPETDAQVAIQKSVSISNLTSEDANMDLATTSASTSSTGTVDYRVHDTLPIEQVVHHSEDSKKYTFIMSKGHLLARTTFMFPTYCNECGKFLYGKKNSGYKCKVCDATVHFKCGHLMGTCEGTRGSILSENARSAPVKKGSTMGRRSTKAEKRSLREVAKITRHRSLDSRNPSSTQAMSRGATKEMATPDFLTELLEDDGSFGSGAEVRPYVGTVPFWATQGPRTLLSKEYTNLNVLFFENLYDGNTSGYGTMHDRLYDQGVVDVDLDAAVADLEAVSLDDFVSLRQASTGVLQTFFSSESTTVNDDSRGESPPSGKFKHTASSPSQDGVFS